MLSQTRINEKTNEHKGALDLFQDLVFKDHVVLGDRPSMMVRG